MAKNLILISIKYNNIFVIKLIYVYFLNDFFLNMFKIL